MTKFVENVLTSFLLIKFSLLRNLSLLITGKLDHANLRVREAYWEYQGCVNITFYFHSSVCPTRSYVFHCLAIDFRLYFPATGYEVFSLKDKFRKCLFHSRLRNSYFSFDKHSHPIKKILIICTCTNLSGLIERLLSST